MELTWTNEIQDALAAPFAEEEIDFLPRSAGGGRALALPYIDARSVMRRLDAVVGAGNWWFDFELLPGDGPGLRVRGRLTVLGVTKCDAGEAADEEEALKAAVSDALKRCAVHFGVGRYLYSLPRVWAAYDSARRRFLEQPRFPAGALERALGIPPENGEREEEAVAGRRREGEKPDAPDSPICSNPECGKKLTRGQHEVSQRGFGRPLCPACQRQQARAAA